MSKNKFPKIYFFLACLIAVLLFFVYLPEATGEGDSSNFTLVWTSNAYTPPEYQGLALPSRGSKIKVFVLPTKKLPINTASLSYNWLLDGEIQGWAQGKDRSVFEFTATRWAGEDHEIKTQVLSQGSVIFERTITVTVAQPEVLLSDSNKVYRENEGLSTKTNSTINLKAIPLFFHLDGLSDLKLSWLIDGQQLEDLGEKNQNIFTLKIPAGSITKTLTKLISVVASNKNDKLQQASADVILEIQK